MVTGQPLAEHNNIRAIRRSLSAITCLPLARVRYLEHEADRLEEALEGVPFALAPGLIQGDPQHRNALHTADGTAVLCDWDTIAQGQPEWDLVTVEVHCRRFGYDEAHYQAFVDAYGLDIRESAGYSVLRDIRELRMVTTNARKVRHAPESLSEIQRRVDGLWGRDDQLQWNILLPSLPAASKRLGGWFGAAGRSRAVVAVVLIVRARGPCSPASGWRGTAPAGGGAAPAAPHVRPDQ
ncbi:phosphotransferase family protein [Streptomyces tanashiensis]|uniref:phosphotransferase family protein n=1 Tax=Streptomyces tanashiensis TaxID=67367 RepID=UPI0033CE4000